MRNRVIADVMVLAGYAALVTAGWTLNRSLGLVVLGVLLVFNGIGVIRNVR